MSNTSRRSRFRARLSGLFSPRTFLVALVLAGLGVLFGGMVPFVGSIGRLVGLFLAGFAVGLWRGERRYAEVGAAGALGAALGFLLGSFGSVFAPVWLNFLADYGVALAGVSAGTGFLVSVVGHYFGRDLRAGLTQDIE